MTEWIDLVARLQRKGIEFDLGLTDTEVNAAEARYGFRFPPDLRAFLQTALPCGDVFPNWRSGEEAQLRKWLALPLEGLLFDVEHNNIWLPAWGTPPNTLKAALQACRQLVAEAPVLIPIYQHRFIPAEPHLAGNPVFSVHQTDIIHYGADLRDYLINEFWPNHPPFGPEQEYLPERYRPIRFWEVEEFQKRWNRESRVVWESES